MRRGLPVILILALALVAGSQALGQTARNAVPRPGAMPAGRPAPADGSMRAEAPAIGGATAVPSPPPAQGFQGLDDNGQVIPPDTNGAVGPADVVTMLNSEVLVQTRAGATEERTALDAWWSQGLTGLIEPFDPRLVYDQIDGHWLAAAANRGGAADSSLLVAASGGADPTDPEVPASWHRLRIDVDPANRLWGDFPTMGFNKDWVVVSINMFRRSDNAFVRSNIYVFDKAALEAGTATTYLHLFTDADGFALQPTETMDPAAAEIYLVQDWTGNATGSGFLRMGKISGSAATPAYTPEVGFASTTAEWSDFPPRPNFLPQRGTTAKIDGGDARMGECQYRDPLGVVGPSVWCAQTVFLPAAAPTRAVVQWWRLSPVTGRALERGRIGGTATTTHYAYPSLAVNRFGDVLLGYSLFGAGRYPAAGYSMHLAGDAPGSMRAPVVTKPGLATYNKTFGAGINRWGDFSHSAVDPQDDEALWTVQEFAAAHQSGASRWGTWWAQAIPATTDLQVAIRDVDPVTAQSPESYDILVTNRGPLGATGVTATVTLPAALLDPINVPAGCAGTAPMICTIGALGANTTAHILLDVTRAAGPGTMSLHVSATATETDRTASDNVATATTTVRAEAGTQYVAVRDSGWTPQVLTVPKGGKVRWNVFGPSDHSAADATPMGLFDTGAITPVHSSAQVTFNAAGTYPVADATGGLPQSRISVLVGSAPLSGTRATNFTIRWAAAAPAAGYVFDVQHRAPGSTLWVPWKTGVTSPSTLWNPTSSTKLGTHGFRARLRKTGVADGFSGWSLGRFVQLHS